jgi:hypothetical protein|tara:strand:- start:100 stop:630 length:531 start_codon:yes stop_codon:yes gene_type:complete
MSTNFQEGVALTVSGVTNWASITISSGPNKLSEKYQVEITLDQESLEKLKALTKDFDILDFLNIKNQEGELRYSEPTVRCKTNKLPTVWGPDKQPFTGFINNGSFIAARIFIKSWEMGGKKGLTAYLNEAAVLNLSADKVVSSGPSDELYSVKRPQVDPSTPAAFSPISTTNDLPF